MKRQLYLWHRWLGIVACLFMALWFVSGVVMLYVGYPKLTPAERLAHLPALPAGCCAELPAQWAQQPLKALRLTSLGGRAHYLLELADGRHVALDATSGELLAHADADWALANARQYAGDAALAYQGTVDEDMWTHSRALDGDRPLHRVRVDDAAGTWLYLSGRSGEVVRDATAQERTWNWVGAWLHWLYPLRGGFGFDNGWRTLVIGLSVLGTLMAILGMAVGILRLRLRTRYRSGSRSPYPGGWLRWHHIGGLLFGGVLVLWVFSGLMSMRPWGLTDSHSQIALQPGPLRAADLKLPVATVLGLLRDEEQFNTVELQWQRLADVTYLVARNADGDSRILEADTPPARAFARQRLLAAAQAMAPGIAVQDDWQTAYDFHYFARDPQSMYGFQSRPLPVLRLRFDDPAATWVYLDPASGMLVASHDRAQRTGRWLFNLLHSWDWQPLLARPLLREGLIIVLSSGGLVIALSGVVLGWRRLRRTLR
ncbi:PepSY domain-containing protein [Pseudomonas carassii]|uniref:PepSY domain-containing protein n=1 Tax=Pseudomonas carassii TaxID=3115855 RepID=A0ABU7HCQ3_9PSED|nr:PepSY domain-containing protein [Pseudomonas sp. 137P]MEE1889091.1 PepSY domain-containing protein [Pseudomonas sp. 137P]